MPDNRNVFSSFIASTDLYKWARLYVLGCRITKTNVTKNINDAKTTDTPNY